jgi:hypothetical protein
MRSRREEGRSLTARSTRDVIATFSIVAFDPETEALGVAVQSKFLAVGAVATQAMANYNYGPRGLGLMAGGRNAGETVEALISADTEREHRQLGVVDGRGRAATFTGDQCFEWAGGLTGEHYPRRATFSSAARPSRRWRRPSRAPVGIRAGISPDASPK